MGRKQKQINDLKRNIALLKQTACMRKKITSVNVSAASNILKATPNSCTKVNYWAIWLNPYMDIGISRRKISIYQNIGSKSQLKVLE